MFDKLPAKIQNLARAAYQRFCVDPTHPSLRLHRLGDNGRGRHREGSYSVTITMQYRAIYVPDGSTNVWYWIGKHNDYESFTGEK
jgi:hypothetical protein